MNARRAMEILAELAINVIVFALVAAVIVGFVMVTEQIVNGHRSAAARAKCEEIGLEGTRRMFSAQVQCGLPGRNR